ncbi:pilus assembly protein PilP [Legionella lansingensis]|nr:pilus assembly protein PilP [Legionella lansingensis]
MSCDSSTKDDLEDYIHMVKKRNVVFKERKRQFHILNKFNYTGSAGCRDPFRLNIPNNIERISHYPRQFLNDIPLSDLRFVGTLKSGSASWGLIKVQGKRISHVRSGDYIGKDRLEVISIKERLLILERQILTKGKWQRKIISLTLSKGSHT